ncbi:TetR/AcrR family transcriptional regulator [uncultured Clostridium sp.]|uniref:TetR/AcrR family transcriptional regulator n=1 Tax=uncultured Clostridium sp. TaxID=59620 RepID=UPI0025E14E7A|nr:TetR/AcrR family transcriptional regulator [uncultured Clostridium sp.]
MNNDRTTKGLIVSAAWELFYKKGYDNTTVDEIIEKSHTSKGAFYHYFKGKDSLLSSLSYLFDKKYEILIKHIDGNMNNFDKLIYLNRELFKMIEESVPIELLASLYSSQLITNGEKHLLDENRVYYRLLKKIIEDGQDNGEIKKESSSEEIMKVYALCERGLIYDWCISKGSYSLYRYSGKLMPMFLHEYKV